MTQNVDLSQLKIDKTRVNPRNKSLKTALMIGAGLLLLFVAYKSTNGFGTKTLEVKTTKVSRVVSSGASPVLTAAGYIVARSKAEISPKAVGRISWINLEEGQKVRKGDLVAKLESGEFSAQRRQIEANLSQALRDRERYAALLEQRAISQQVYESADTQVKNLQAQLDYYGEQIRNSEIYAPISGTVTVKKAYLGETVSPQGLGGAGAAGASFAVIVDMDTLEMEADVSEQNLSKITSGQPAEIVLDAYPNKAYRAKLRQIIPTADRQKGSIKVKIELLEKDEKILPEMSARATFLNKEPLAQEKREEKILVALDSVVKVGEEEGVLVVNGDVATFTPVAFEEKTSTHGVVSSGLSGGETIVAGAYIQSTSWKKTQKVKPQTN